jgi:thiol-disulfide isomerase/thioredoxin
MVFNSAMKSLKKFCKEDDTCIFIILVLIGFLLCMFFNRDEGFADYPFGDSEEKVEEKHDYGGIGKEPTKHASIEDTIEPPEDPTMPQIAKAEQLTGMMPQDPGMPQNITQGTLRSIQMAKGGKQYNSEILPNTGGISVVGFSLDKGSMSVPLEYSAYTPGSRYKDGPPSDLGPQFPTGEPNVPDMNKELLPRAQAKVQSQDTGSGLSADTGATSNKDMKLVLFYAPWCGHSKNMIGDYDSVISQYDGKQMNGVTLHILKVDMDADKKGAQPYGVEIKGFPTLYTFVEENGKLVPQPFSQRDEKGIIEELQKRTGAIGSQ